MKTPKQELFHVSSDIIRMLETSYGGKWFCEIRALNIDPGVCFNKLEDHIVTADIDFKVKEDNYRLSVTMTEEPQYGSDGSD